VNGTAAYQRTLRSEFEDISFGPPGMEEVDADELPFGQPNNWRLGLVVSQPLFDGFRTPAAVAQAKAGVRVAELGVRATRAQVALSVTQAYYDAALAQRQVEIAEVTLRQAERTRADTELNFRQGAAPEFVLVRAEVARDNQTTLLVQYKAQRDVAFVQLRRLVGVRLDQPHGLSTKLEADDVEQVITAVRAAACLAQELQRLVVRQAAEAVTAREAAVRVAKSERWPTIAAGSDFGLVNYERSPVRDAWRTNWTIGVTLTLPIFDGLRRRAQIQTANAELTAARAQQIDATEVSSVEVAQAAASVTASATTLETNRRTVGQAQRAYEIAELRFQQGASTHLELVDARVQLELALLNLARASRDVRVSRARQALLPGLPLGATGGF
jgi:outer membrane protein TolC